MANETERRLTGALSMFAPMTPGERCSKCGHTFDIAKMEIMQVKFQASKLHPGKQCMRTICLMCDKAEQN